MTVGELARPSIFGSGTEGPNVRIVWTRNFSVNSSLTNRSLHHPFFTHLCPGARRWEGQCAAPRRVAEEEVSATARTAIRHAYSKQELTAQQNTHIPSHQYASLFLFDLTATRFTLRRDAIYASFLCLHAAGRAASRGMNRHFETLWGAKTPFTLLDQSGLQAEPRF